MSNKTAPADRVLIAVGVMWVCAMCVGVVNTGIVTKRAEFLRKNAVWVHPLHYINNVTSSFAKRVQEYGVGNLPVPDKVYKVNVTRYNIPLRGQLNFSAGFVANIMNVSRHPRDFIWFISNDGASVEFKMFLANVTVVYELLADLEGSNTSATAVLTFPSNYVHVTVTFNTVTHKAEVKAMTTNSVAGPRAKLTPDSSVVKAIAYNIRLTMASSLFGDLTKWIDHSLQSLMTATVQELSFPLRIRRVKRRPGTRALRARRRQKPVAHS